MEKKGKWRSAVKNAFRFLSASKSVTSPARNGKERNGDALDQGQVVHDPIKSAKRDKWRWRFAGKSLHSGGGYTCAMEISSPIHATMPQHLIKRETKGHGVQNESKHAMAVAAATAAAAEAAVAAAHAAVEAVRLSVVARANSSRLTSSSYPVRNKEEQAAIKIQTAIRAYQARRAFRSLRGLARLQTVVGRQAVQRQTLLALRNMQALVRVQVQVQASRVRRAEEVVRVSSQRQLWQKRHQEMTRNLKPDNATDANHDHDHDWDPSGQTTADIVARKLSKQEAALRRERALAYGNSHQLWRPRAPLQRLNKKGDPAVYWGWSWLDRWLAAWPWDASHLYTEISKSISSSGLLATSSLANPSSQRYCTVAISDSRSHGRSSSIYSSAADHQQDRGSVSSSSIASFYSMGPKSHSSKTKATNTHGLATSSIRDDESLTSSFGIPSYMAATQSAQAKVRCRPHSSPKQRPSRETSTNTSGKGHASVCSAKRRPPFPMIDSDKDALSMPMQPHGLEGSTGALRQLTNSDIGHGIDPGGAVFHLRMNSHQSSPEDTLG